MSPSRLTPLLALSALCLAALWASALASPVPYLYSDGDTATWIWLLRHRAAIYAAPAGLPLWSTNYPPLYLRLVAWLAPSDGEVLRAGGLLSLLGFALAAASVFASSAAIAGRRAGAQAALLLCGTLPVSYYAPACLPDALALGLGCLATTLVARRAPGWPLLAALLFATSALAKHSLIVLPAGVCGWALLREPRRGVVLTACTGGLVALWLWRLDLFAPLFTWTLAPWRLRNLLAPFALWVLPLSAGVALALAMLRRAGELPDEARRALGPWAGALLCALPWTLALGRTGSGSNYTMELCAALAVLTCAAAARGVAPRLFAAHVVAVAVLSLSIGTYYLARVLPAMRREMALTAATLAGTSGPVLAESTWYATALGRPPVVIPFLAAQLAQAGRWDPAPLLDGIRERHIEWLQLSFPLDGAPVGGQADRLVPGLLELARPRYRLAAHTDGVYLYRALRDGDGPSGAAAR